MKRYLLFSGSDYYPEGGWCDFRGDFETDAEAFAAVHPGDGWCHVIDAETGSEMPEPDFVIQKRKDVENGGLARMQNEHRLAMGIVVDPSLPEGAWKLVP